jgi:hypothetical protein
MVRWAAVERKQQQRVRASLLEITRLRDDLSACAHLTMAAIVEMTESQRNMDCARGDGRLTETEHLRLLRRHLGAMGKAEDALMRVLYLTRQYNRWPLR